MAKKKVTKLDVLPLYLWQLKIFVPILVLVMLLLSALIYNNFTVSQAQKLAELRNLEHELKDNLIKNYGQVKNVPAYQAKFAELTSIESQINSRFPSSDEVSSLLIQINQVAEDSNISITSFTPKEMKEVNLSGSSFQQKKIMSETFIIVANAKYLNFADFIYRLAKLSRVIDVQNLHLSRIDDNTINVTFDIKIYFSSK